MMLHITNTQARRLLLYLQGLSETSSKRLTRQHLYTLIVRMGFVQVDSIRTVERAHHLTLMSRNAHYRPDMLQALLEDDRLLFENWTHDAAIIPTQWYPYWQPRFVRARQIIARSQHWLGRLGADAQQVLDRVRQRVRDHGPVMARELTEMRTPGVGVWWGWGPSKTALEYLWRTGELAICGRVNFQKVYDLSERVIAEMYHSQLPSEADYIDWACQTALDRLGCATPSELAAFWGHFSLADAQAWCKRHNGNTIRKVLVDSADGSAPRPAYARHDIDALLRELPTPTPRVRFLSPFDPVIRDRKRAMRLFNFDYRFEAFVPAPQRQYGYYVLPILERDRFIGRIDLKCDRKARTLVVNGLWFERGVRQSKTRNDQIAKELERYRAFVGASSIVYRDPPLSVTPSRLAITQKRL
jgi:uncharacterized protein